MKKKFSFAILSIAITAFIISAMWRSGPLDYESSTVAVHAVTVQRSDITSSVICTGSVEPAAKNELRSGDTLRIDEIAVEIGDAVQSGDLLFTATVLNAEDFQRAGFVPDYSIYTDEIGDAIIAAFSDYFGSGNSESVVTYMYAQEDGTLCAYSPFDGIVTTLNIYPDAIILPSTNCLTLSDTSRLQIRSSVDENYIQDISCGMTCSITGNAFRGYTYTGTVAKIMPFAEKTQSLTGSGNARVEVLIDVDNPDEHLKCGYTTKSEIFVTRREQALTIPYEALTRNSAGEDCVYVITDDWAQLRQVKTGLELLDGIEIIEGLEAGEQIIINPTQAVTNGTKVQVTV